MPPNLAQASYDRPVAVIGDIHGNSALLRQLLDALPPHMPVLVLGDLCDRGPDTRGVYDLLIARNAAGVRGNHDEWFIKWVTGEGFDSYALSFAMGGRQTLGSYGVEGRWPGAIEEQRFQVPAAHRKFAESLPIALDLTVMGREYWLIHAGVPNSVELPGLSAEQVVPFMVAEKPDALLWPHTQPNDVLPLGRTVIMGHVCLRRPFDNGFTIGVDTGCSTIGGGRLTAVILPERRFVTVG